jgi:hypothetical protein
LIFILYTNYIVHVFALSFLNFCIFPPVTLLDFEVIVAHANRIRARYASGDLLDRETTKNLLATVLLTGSREPEPCVLALTSLLQKCGFNKAEIHRIKDNMELEERTQENEGGSIFGWFGAAPPSPPPKRHMQAMRGPTREEMLNASMMSDYDEILSSTSSGTETVELDLS